MVGIYLYLLSCFIIVDMADWMLDYSHQDPRQIHLILHNPLNWHAMNSLHMHLSKLQGTLRSSSVVSGSSRLRIACQFIAYACMYNYDMYV